ILFSYRFQGILFVQAYIYYESFPEDPWQLKSLNGTSTLRIIRCLDFAHLVLICQTSYHYLIDNWGDSLALLESTIELDLHLVLVGTATILCQGFFLHRVWMFSRRNWILVAVLGAMCMTTVGLDITMTVQLSQNTSIATINGGGGREVVAMFSIGAGVDMIIAILLCWYLMQGRTPFEQTNFVLTRIIQYTIATGLATSLLSLGCVAAGMHFSLGRMYTNALLATLNSRRNLRGMLGHSAAGMGLTSGSLQTRSGPAFVVTKVCTHSIQCSLVYILNYLFEDDRDNSGLCVDGERGEAA
ncbi:hypothetical protein B0H15DRAFT_780761, partial [Mycena belliarum]